MVILVAILSLRGTGKILDADSANWSIKLDAADERILVADARDTGLESSGSSGTWLLSLDFLVFLSISSIFWYSGCFPSILEELLVLVYCFLVLEGPAVAVTAISRCEVSTVNGIRL